MGISGLALHKTALISDEIKIRYRPRRCVRGAGELIDMSKPIRILEVVNIMDRAGLETMLMNHYRHIDRNMVQMDFLTHRPLEGAYDNEIQELGGRVFHAPRLYPQNCLAYRRYMRSFFADYEYPVVHSHIDAMSAFPLSMARSCGVAVRVAHSHSDSVDRDVKYPIKEIARKRLPSIATHYWACSEAAGTFLFGESNRRKLHIVKNAVDLSGFAFNSPSRAKIRSELAVADGQIVIGHVGRFSAVKNQAFLLNVLAAAVDSGEDVVLAFVGDGELRSRVEQDAASAGLSSRVRFLGLRDDVACLMQGFDVLVFPSLHEGIPLTLVEAQASGLPVLASDEVSSEVLVLPNCGQMALSESVEKWAAAACGMARSGRAEGCIDALTAEGYEINQSAKSLQETYLSLYEGVHR